MDKTIILRLYIAGITIYNQQAILELKKSLQNNLEAKYKLEIIDILTHPELAEGDKIFATPTIVKLIPEPIKKVILDFNDSKRLLIGMDLIK